MKILKIFGIGNQKIISEKNSVDGVVTSVKTCWWLKVNKKLIRMSSLDGAEFPHIISFIYNVDGTEYKGSRYISWTTRCPQSNEKITVFFDKSNPSQYAVDI